MLEITNKLLVCKSDLYHSFAVPKRMVFDTGKGEKPKESSDDLPGSPKEKDKTPEEIDKILNGSKEKGVKFEADHQKNLEAIAKKVYSTKEKQDLFVMEMSQAIDEAVKKGDSKGDVKSFWEFLATTKCENVTINKEGKFEFRGKEGKAVELGQLKPKGVAIDQGPQKPEAPAKKPEEGKKEEPAKPATPKESGSVVPENTVDELTAKALFDKIFPSMAKDKQSTVKIQSNKYGAGSFARIPNVRDLPLYKDDGGKSSISNETLGDFRKPPIAKITKPFVVIAATPYGIQKYVYIETTIEGSVQKGSYTGWVEESRLRDINRIAPEEKVGIAVDEAKIAEEKKKTDAAEKAKKDRAPYLDEKGTVILKDAKQTKEVKLQTLFPNAVKGDQVTVTSKMTGSTTTATFDGKDWVDSSNKHVPIYNGDKVVPLSKVDKEAEKPNAPALAFGESFLEKEPRKFTDVQIAESKNGKLKWNDIAKELMEQYPAIAETGTKRPEYAKLLKKYSTETGYYFVVLPEKVKPSALDEAAKEIAEGQKAAKERTKKGKTEIEKRAEKTYSKHEGTILRNEYLFVKGTVNSQVLNDLVNDKDKWKEAWDKNYPLNSKLIVQAFRRPPFDGIAETAIREGVRQMIYAMIGDGKFKFSTLFDVFNKNGGFYKKMGGDGGSHSDFMKEWNLVTEELPRRKEENKKKGKPINYGFSEEENSLYFFRPQEDLRQVMVGAAGIFEAIVNSIRPEAEKPEFKKVVETRGPSTMTKEDKVMSAAYTPIINNNDDVTTGEAIDEYINDEKKWNDLWEKDQGNIGLLKKALQRPPYNKQSLGAYKSQIREATHDKLSKNDVNMGDILDYVNAKGQILLNHDGKPASYSDFKNEMVLEQLGRYKKEGQTLTAEQQKFFDDCPYKEQLGGPRYDELTEMWVSSAYVLDAISKLDPTVKYVERAPEADQPKVYLDGIFSPTDTGSINGKSQDYSDTYKEGGETIAGGGIFTGGLFKYDFRDRAKGISDFDKVSSQATANTIIADQCRNPDGTINNKKLQIRLNDLLTLGISSLLSEPDSEQKTAAIEALGLTKEDLKRADIIPFAAKKHEIKFGKDSTLSPAQKDLVRLGFLLETAAKPGQVKEVSETPIEWSIDPKIRVLQKAALRMGAKPQDMPKIEAEMKSQTIAFLHMKVGKNFSGIDEAGITIPIHLAGEGKNVLYLAISPAYNFAEGKFEMRAGIGGSVEIARNVSLLGGVGAGTDFQGNWSLYAGAGIRFDIPVDKDTVWEPNLTIGAMASITPANLSKSGVIVGATLMWERNLGKQVEQDLKKKLEESGFAEVEKTKDVHQKAALLRNIPGPNGMVIAQIDANLDLTDEQLVSLYEQHIRKKIETLNAQAGLSEHKFLGFLPPVTAAGFGVGVKFGPEGVSVLPGVAFAIAIASELVIFQRPNASTESLAAGAEADMGKQAEAAILAKQKFIADAKKAGYSKISFESAPLAGDMETGMKPIKQESAVVKSEGVDKPDQVALDKQFQEFSKELLAKGLKLEKVDKMYRLEVLNVGNVQLYVDPQMAKNMGVFLKDGAVFISASQNPTLVIKRLDMYYPRPKEGNLKHTIVTISDQDFRTQKSIMDESDFYIDSRTKDNTGAERTPLRYLAVDNGREAKQANFLQWSKDGKYAYDNLDTTTEDMLKYREQAGILKRQGELGQKVAKDIGTFEFQAIDVAKIHGLAAEFMGKHALLYRQYTTYQLKSKADLKKLDDQIRKDYPKLDDNEIAMMKEELFNMSMIESEKQLKGLTPEKRKEKLKSLVLEKLDWMKTSIYIPMFQEYLNKENNPSGFTAEQCAEAFLGPLRAMALENPESVPLGARLDVAVGTLGVLGRRGVVVANPDTIKDHRLYVAKDYSAALASTAPSMDRTIALVLREKQRPMEKLKDDAQFLNSPWAIKLMLLGFEVNKPILLKILGEDAYKKLSDCYATKPPKVAEGAADAVKELKNIAMLLNDVQMGKGGVPILVNGKEFRTITINGMIMGVRTNSLKSGVYERCLNAADMYDDVLLGIDTSEKFTLVNNIRSYNSATSQSLVSTEGIRTTNIGLGAVFELGPTAPPPGGEIPKTEDPEPVHEGSTGGDMPVGEIPVVPPAVIDTTPTPGGGGTPSDI